MNAQDVTAFLNKIDSYRNHVHTEFNGDVYIPKNSVLPENKTLFDEMFELAKAIEPSDWYSGGNDRGFWIWTDLDIPIWLHTGNIFRNTKKDYLEKLILKNSMNFLLGILRMTAV